MGKELREKFDVLLEGNAAYAPAHVLAAETGVARHGLAIVTCIDSRLDPLRIFGLEPGDAKIIRNAGARITDDAIRSLSVSCAVLGVKAIAVVPHTRCKMAETAESDAAAAVSAATGRDASATPFLTVDGQEKTLRADVETLRSSPLIPDEVDIAGFVLDLDTGLLHPVC